MRPITIIILIALLSALVYRNREIFTDAIAPKRDVAGAEQARREGERRVAEGRIPEAIAAFRRAVELDPENPVPHASLGLIHSSRQELDLALSHWSRAAELAPHILGYKKRLITTYAELDSLKRALALLEEALAQHPGDDQLLVLKQLIAKRTSAEGEDAAPRVPRDEGSGWVPLEPTSSGTSSE